MKKKFLVHIPSNVAFEINGDSKASSTYRGIVSAHISNFFNANKNKVQDNPNTQAGLIIERMIQNLSSTIPYNYNESREKTINEFILVEIKSNKK